jgi:uncharacterized 2Fe-2S/4Fe-4S cluster protein (DUF4445 family)
MTPHRTRATWTVPSGLAPGTTLLDALRDEGIVVPAECGGVGTCGLCAVRVAPAPEPSTADREHIDAARLAEGWRLACGTQALRGMVVHLPEGALRAPVSARAATRRRRDADPPGGAFDDGAGDAPADGSPAGLALAVDLGTTTVCVSLVSRQDGARLADATAPNAQRAFGGDVVSRIEYGSRGPAELARLRDAAADSIRAAAGDACRDAGVLPGEIAGGAIACNPTMAHLLLGANPAPLGRAPFRLVVPGTVILPAGRIGFPGAPDALVTLLPAASATLGGDAIGGAVAQRFDRGGDAARLLVDVGTNTEMILCPGGRRAPLAASAASGGAFEGASISCGMRAGPGAVSSAWWSGEALAVAVEGGGEPQGVSGTGLLDLVALLRRFGLVDPSGRMLPREALYGKVPPELLGRLLPAGEEGGRFLVARAKRGAVTLSAADIRQFQLAKGAVRAALDLLLEAGGLAAGDVAEAAIAGAFGAGIDEGSAVAVGLFPDAFRGRLTRAGNASLAAAVESVRNARFVRRVDAFAGQLRTLSLPDQPTFQERFLAAMAFPG